MKYIRITVAKAADFEPGSFRTIWFDRDQDIKAVYGRKPGERKESLQALLFITDGTFGWTEPKAQTFCNYQGHTQKGKAVEPAADYREIMGGEFKAEAPPDTKHAILRLKGYASTRVPDRVNEIVEPTAFTDTMGIYMRHPVLLFGHRWCDKPIGKVVDYTIDDFGLHITVDLLDTVEGRDCKVLVESGVLRGFSIGFDIVELEYGQNGDPDRILKLLLKEISLVNVPCNWETLVDETEEKNLAVKSLLPSPGSTRQGHHKPINRRVKMPDPNVGLKEVNQEIDAALAPHIDDLGNVKTTIGDLKSQVDDLLTKSGAAKDALAEQVKQTTAEIATKMDKIIPDIEKSITAMAKEIEEVKKQKIPQGFAQVSPFTSKQLVEMPRERIKAFHAAPVEGMINDFREQTDRLLMLDMFMCAESEQFKKGYHHLPHEKRIKSLKSFEKWDTARKAMDTATAGEGLEWIPTELSTRLAELVRIELRVGGLFDRIQMPTNPYRLPVLTADTIAKLVTETIAVVSAFDANEETPTTAKVEWSAKVARGRIQVSQEYVEDSIVPALPLMERVLTRSIRRAEDMGLLNGDDSGTHMDDDYDGGAATLFQKAFKGIRKLTPAGSKEDFSGHSAADDPILAAIRACKASMGKYAQDPSRIPIITSLKVIMMYLLNVAAVQTLDKLGPQAVILTGQLAQVDGQAIIASEFSRDDTAATGVNTSAGPNTKSLLQMPCLEASMIGDRGSVIVGQEYDMLNRVYQVAGFKRFDFQPLFAVTETMNGLVYNIG